MSQSSNVVDLDESAGRTAAQLHQILSRGDRAVWAATALALALRDDTASDQRRAARSVLNSIAPDLDLDSGQLDRRGLSAQAAAPILQAAALLTDKVETWAGQTDDAILAQGRASAQGAKAVVQYGLPMLSGLPQAMAAPGARMLDVGTGVAALAVAYAELFPALTVVGIDVLPRVLRLAEETRKASTVADRVVLRQQDVGTLDEVAVYALAFLPAPFVPETALRAGVSRIARALIPGGWVLVAHGKFAGDPIDDAVTRFRTIAYGGTSLDDTQAEVLLEEAGFVDIMSAPTPPGAPAITVGRRSPVNGVSG